MAWGEQQETTIMWQVDVTNPNLLYSLSDMHTANSTAESVVRYSDPCSHHSLFCFIVPEEGRHLQSLVTKPPPPRSRSECQRMLQDFAPKCSSCLRSLLELALVNCFLKRIQSRASLNSLEPPTGVIGGILGCGSP